MWKHSSCLGRLACLAAITLFPLAVCSSRGAAGELPNQIMFAAGKLDLRPGANISLSGLTLTYQPDGNLVARDSSNDAVWASGTLQHCQASSCRAVFQGDGNFVLYNDSKPYWQAGTAHNPGAKLTLTNRVPYLSITAETGADLWKSPPLVLGTGDLTPISVTWNGKPICSSGGLGQVPGNPTVFVGRYYRDPVDPSRPVLAADCNRLLVETSHHLEFGLALFHMDWAAQNLAMGKSILASRVAFPGVGTLVGGIDPTVAAFNGELWVAWECGGFGFKGISSSCIAPLDLKQEALDMRRATNVVQGISSSPADPYNYSGSVPKILGFKGKLYLYWTAVKATKAGNVWQTLTTRGMELVQEPGGLKRLWGAGSGFRPVASYDPKLNVEVMSLKPRDPLSNLTADTGGVYTDGQAIYVTTSIGGTGNPGDHPCLAPNALSDGCYRLQISKTERPLGSDSFNDEILKAPDTIYNPTSYARIIAGPDGKLFMLAAYGNENARETHARPGSLIATSGWLAFPLNLRQLIWTSAPRASAR
jgi:hypothetical protein